MSSAIRLVQRRRAAGGSLLILAMLMGGSVAGCSGSQAGGTDGQSVAAQVPDSAAAPQVPMGSMTMPTSEESAAVWDARPAYVRDAVAQTQVAYAFALARPDVLQWLPCYCGCASMGHRNNLDCFLHPRQGRASLGFEEHASFCDVCVKTATMAQQMLRQGKTMIQIRAAVDSAFGSLAPGTPTDLPPS